MIADVAPTGSALMHELDAAGGVPAILSELAPFLDLKAQTVAGCTLAEAIGTSLRGTSKGPIRRRDTP